MECCICLEDLQQEEWKCKKCSTNMCHHCTLQLLQTRSDTSQKLSECPVCRETSSTLNLVSETLSTPLIRTEEEQYRRMGTEPHTEVTSWICLPLICIVCMAYTIQT